MRRSKMEIIGSILRVAWNGELKTNIMFKASLSFAQLNRYLEFLNDKGLLAKGAKRALWVTTEKGKEFLKYFMVLKNLLEPEG